MLALVTDHTVTYVQRDSILALHPLILLLLSLSPQVDFENSRELFSNSLSEFLLVHVDDAVVECSFHFTFDLNFRDVYFSDEGLDVSVALFEDEFFCELSPALKLVFEAEVLEKLCIFAVCVFDCFEVL